MTNKKMEVICFENFQNYQYLKQSHLWKTLMIQVVSLALVFFKISWIFHSSLQSKYFTVISKDEPSRLWLKELGKVIDSKIPVS